VTFYYYEFLPEQNDLFNSEYLTYKTSNCRLLTMLIHGDKIMLISQLFKIIFVLFAVSGALIYKLANVALSKLLLPAPTTTNSNIVN